MPIEVRPSHRVRLGKTRQYSTHYIWFDRRTPGTLFYQAWYGQGLRAFDISNPYAPKEVGRSGPGRRWGARQTREVYLEPQTNLVYMTDGNGGGLTVLRYTGPLPAAPSISGVRDVLR